jgi:hypothetical protein
VKILLSLSVDARDLEDAKIRLARFLSYTHPENFGMRLQETPINLELFTQALEALRGIKSRGTIFTKDQYRQFEAEMQLIDEQIKAIGEFTD